LCQRQLEFRSQREDLVLAADENVREPFDVIVAHLEGRVVIESNGESSLEKVAADAAFEVQGIADFGFPALLRRLDVERQNGYAVILLRLVQIHRGTDRELIAPHAEPGIVAGAV